MYCVALFASYCVVFNFIRFFWSPASANPVLSSVRVLGWSSVYCKYWGKPFFSCPCLGVIGFSVILFRPLSFKFTFLFQPWTALCFLDAGMPNLQFFQLSLGFVLSFAIFQINFFNLQYLACLLSFCQPKSKFLSPSKKHCVCPTGCSWSLAEPQKRCYFSKPTVLYYLLFVCLVL